MRLGRGVINHGRIRFLRLFQPNGWMCCILIVLTGCKQDSESAIAFYLQTDHDWRKATEEITKANNSVIREIELEADKRHQYKPMQLIAQKADEVVKGFNLYIDSLRNDLIQEAGIIITNGEKPALISGHSSGIRDNSAVRRYFESGTPRNDEKMRQKIQDFKNSITTLIDTMIKIIPKDVALIKEVDIAELKANMQVGSLTGSLIDKSIHDEMNDLFQSPPYIVFAKLSRLQNNTRTTEFKLVNYLSGKIGHMEPCSWWPVIASCAESDFVIIDEKYKTDIFLSSDSNTPAALISIKVDGKSIPIYEGKGIYQTIAKNLGENYYHVEIVAKRDEMPKPETFSRTFKYEAGYRCY